MRSGELRYALRHARMKAKDRPCQAGCGRRAARLVQQVALCHQCAAQVEIEKGQELAEGLVLSRTRILAIARGG